MIRQLYSASTVFGLCLAAALVVRSFFVSDNFLIHDRWLHWATTVSHGRLFVSVYYTNAISIDPDAKGITISHHTRTPYLSPGYAPDLCPFPRVSFFSGDEARLKEWRASQPRPAETTVRVLGFVARTIRDLNPRNGPPGSVYERHFSVSLLYIMLPFCVMSGLSFRGVWKRRLARLRGRTGRCIKCGYDLRATPDRCPECGTPVPSKPDDIPKPIRP